MASFTQGHALIVGAGADLPNTVDDATALADILGDEGRCGYPPDQVHLLTGSQATRQAILASLGEIGQQAGAGDTVVVYFSGHGYQVASPLGEFYYLLPNGYDLDRLYQTAINGAEFATALRAIAAQKLLLLLDCCHAGGVGASARDQAKAPAGLAFTKSPLPREAHALLAEGSGRVIIASSLPDELSYAGRPYSAFTLALIEALSGVGAAEQDGYVRVADLALHARQVVPGRTGDRQHPILRFEQADNFAIAYYAGGETQPKGLPFREEPQIEPQPGAWTLDQHGQIVSGTQVNVAGDVSGQLAVGGDAIQLGDIRGETVHIGGRAAPSSTKPDAAERAEANMARVWRMLAALKSEIRADVPAEKEAAALARIDELEGAILAPAPDRAVLDQTCRWFARNLPGLARKVEQVVRFVYLNA